MSPTKRKKTARLSDVHISAQPVAAEILERLRALNARHRFRLTFRRDRAQVALPFWLDIIDAICDHNPVAARAALQRHAKNVQEAMRALAYEPTPFATMYASPLRSASPESPRPR